MPEVRKERTGWRDQGISEEHRKWGWDCPAIDIDFLVVEYDKAEPVALVEYKSEKAFVQNILHSSYVALSRLGTRAGIPFFVVTYSSGFSMWMVVPVNEIAKAILTNKEIFTKQEYKEFLYKLRGRIL
jgi:hypothetical protein